MSVLEVSALMSSVLLIDSFTDARNMYAVWLRSVGFDTVEEDNAASGLARVRDADVIVTGLQLHGPFDGVELIRRVRADERTFSKPIVVLTACAGEADRQRAVAAGCDVFLTKPCPPDVLAQEIQAVLDRFTSASQTSGSPEPNGAGALERQSGTRRGYCSHPG